MRSKSNYNNRSNKSIKCYRCGRRGHIRSQCTHASSNDASGDKAWSLVDGEAKLSSRWIIDSGATSHMCKNDNNFSSLIRQKHKIVLASGGSIYAHGKGTVILRTKYSTINLRDVWYVPGLHSNFP